jgi:ATP-dependent Lon protease
LIPKENVRDLTLLPERVRTELNIVAVKTMDEVLDLALVDSCRPKKPRHR